MIVDCLKRLSYDFRTPVSCLSPKSGLAQAAQGHNQAQLRWLMASLVLLSHGSNCLLIAHVTRLCNLRLKTEVDFVSIFGPPSLSICINKANKAELSHAIKSMFLWYRNAARCYVYMSDVSSPLPETSKEATPPPWVSDFQKSRWLTRGWTLQELLAPGTVEFFSRERRKLGDKLSLAQQVHEITGIPHFALQGASLSQFTSTGTQNFKKMGHTHYSAFSTRLLDEIQKLGRCIQDIRLTDPRDDKKRIEDTKGGLLEGSYRWVLSSASFQQWNEDPQNRLLRITGDPGKGKTMLLCGIIEELKKSTPGLLSFFFCEGTDSRINSATAVLRGLIYLLVNQQPLLAQHLRKKYDQAGQSLRRGHMANDSTRERDPNKSSELTIYLNSAVHGYDIA
ncbi:HET-domain-containing protein [Lindgomyces ingoldianus]|uniref:HET-domain-containing protein n=1 Tax=Lindgomyces ingoldianus TaxID=673940 RepID=A0ACB6QN97_9PLEO|nr:HET-domain-containing protein [Lindgomyces ingoldianus]KAF2468371.1 HET-domain-containing protein [Lindgomyces ingoldianus]